MIFKLFDEIIRYRYILYFFILVQFLLLQIVVNTSYAEIHNVKVHDHYFEPKSITINEGDTVRFEWIGEFHDVVSGTFPQYDGAFKTELGFTGGAHEVLFNRDFLLKNPESDFVYEYYCTPHARMGMTGAIKVNRTIDYFGATLTSWQINTKAPKKYLEPSQSIFILSEDEKNLQISGEHFLDDVSEISIYRGTYNTDGEKICTLSSIEKKYFGTCAVNEAQAASLYASELYLLIKTASFPEGALRGQIVASGNNGTIHGTLSEGSTPIKNALISNGFQVTRTDSEGKYTFKNLFYGVYLIEAFSQGRYIHPDENESLALVTNSTPIVKNFLITSQSVLPNLSPSYCLAEDGEHGITLANIENTGSVQKDLITLPKLSASRLQNVYKLFNNVTVTLNNKLLKNLSLENFERVSNHLQKGINRISLALFDSNNEKLCQDTLLTSSLKQLSKKQILQSLIEAIKETRTQRSSAEFRKSIITAERLFKTLLRLPLDTKELQISKSIYKNNFLRIRSRVYSMPAINSTIRSLRKLGLSL
jgi:plastocyanin